MYKIVLSYFFYIVLGFVGSYALFADPMVPLRVSVQDNAPPPSQASPQQETQTEPGTSETNPKDILKNETPPLPETPVQLKQKLEYFHSINLSGIGNLHITQAEESDFTVEAEPSILPLVIVYVKDQVLYIDLKDASQHEQAQINYYLKIKTLREINSYSSSTIFIPERFEAKILMLSMLSGFGEAHLNIDVTTLITKIVGAGKVEVQGVADEQELTIAGVGEFDGSKLKSQEASVIMTRTGIAKINASDELHVKIAGDSQVKYCGNPNVVKELSGKATIEPLDKIECQK